MGFQSRNGDFRLYSKIIRQTYAVQHIDTLHNFGYSNNFVPPPRSTLPLPLVAVVVAVVEPYYYDPASYSYPIQHY